MKLHSYKKTFIFTSLLALPLLLSAANKKYVDVTASSRNAQEFFEGFELINKVSPKFSLVRGEGINGNRALCYKADKPREKIEIQKFYLDLKRNWNYKLIVHFRTENLKNHNKWLAKAREFALSGVDFIGKNNKYISGRYRAIQIDPNNREYQVFELDFNTPVEFEKVILNIYMPILWTGTIYYDDISIKPQGAAPARVYQFEPKMLRIGKDNKITLRTDNISRGNEKDLSLLVEFNGKRSIYPIKNGNSTIKFTKLKKGENKYRAAIVNKKTLELFGWHDLTVYNYSFAPAITFDKDGYLYKNGKKFLPIGVFAHSRLLRAHHLPILKDAGCNFVMTYRAELLKVAGLKLANALRIRAGLDEFHKNDMMILFAMNGHLKSRNSFVNFAGAKGYENSIRKIAAVITKHPALMGWYTTDENPPKELPEAALLRNLLTQGDGRHPIVALTNKARDVADFATTGDMIMLDDYPFVNAKTQSMASTRKLVTANNNTRIPAILVPQAFNWGAYRKPAEKYRFPTEEEIRSQSLLGFILGCKGICFYSYTSVLERQENAFPGTTKDFLAGLFRITKMLKEYEPFLISNEKAPSVKIISRGKSRVDAKAFKHGKKVIVLVTADGPGIADATLSIPGLKGKLKSRFNLTKVDAKGNYVFKAKNVNSDVLEGELL